MSPVGEAGVVLVPVHLQSILYRERDDKRYVYMMSSEGERRMRRSIENILCSYDRTLQ